jgi:hypothetical protein
MNVEKEVMKWESRRLDVGVEPVQYLLLNLAHRLISKLINSKDFSYCYR